MLTDLGGSARSMPADAQDRFMPYAVSSAAIVSSSSSSPSCLDAGNENQPGATVSRHLLSITKRLFDIVLALLLLAVALPLMIQIALAVKLTSKGPVLFKQIRSGCDGRTFEILKFRTMRCEPNLDTTSFIRQASIDDDRTTAVGRWMRRLSLDELPQFINVLKGDMSLVGPRPHAIGHDRYYAEHIANYTMRFRGRPGITGLAQISGARGPTSTHADMQRRLDFDLSYTSRATLFLDLAILFKTAAAMFRWDEAF